MFRNHHIFRTTTAGVLFLATTILSPIAWGGEEEVLTNQSVIRLTKLGFPNELIIKKIHGTLTDFDLTVKGLASLDEAGVSAEVIGAMIDQDSGVAEANRIGASPTGDLQAIASPGIYVELTEGGQTRIERVEPTVFTQQNAGGMMKSAFTLGFAKIKIKMVLPGSSARLRIPNRQPTFYFNLGDVNSGFGPQAEGPTTASQFVLARFEVKSKKGRAHRELIVAKAGVTGVRTGALEETTHEFEVESFGPGLYRVRPQTELPPGEYVFYWAGIEEGGNIFDFGIDM